MNRLNIYKTHPGVQIPFFATKQSACFDLSYNASGKREYKGYNSYNAPFTRLMNDQSITLMPGDRVMVPTGLILDIPDGYSVRVHARSGLSLKQGLVLVNSEGVIDSDYVEELFILLTNNSENAQVIKNGDRIAQAELVKKEEYALWEIFEAPKKKTDRDGGMGSTGIVVETLSVPVVKIVEEPVKRGRGRPKKALTNS